MAIGLLCMYQSVNAQADPVMNQLKVGDKSPPLKAFKWIKGNPVTEFKKGRIYVVEFGATWCTPCAVAIPHLTALAKTHAGAVSVVGLFVMELNQEPASTKNPQYVKKVETYVAKQGLRMEYNVAVDDPYKTMEKSWLTAAGRIGVPVTFVIDKAGRVAWIGSNPQMLDGIVEQVSSKDYELAKMVKRGEAKVGLQISYDESKPLLIDDNGGDDHDFMFRSILVKSKTILPGGHQDFIQSWRWIKGTKFDSLYSYNLGRVQEINAPIEHLYYMAYSDTLLNMSYSRNSGTRLFPDTIQNPHQKRSYSHFWYRPILEVKDTTPFVWTYKSSANMYHYSLQVPPEKATAAFLQGVMQRDLKTYFGYDVTVETRKMPCWILKATPEARKKLQSKHPGKNLEYIELENEYHVNNHYMLDIINFLEIYFGQRKSIGIKGAPFVDETGIIGQIEYSTRKDEYDEVVKDYKVAERWLNRIGITIDPGERDLKVIVIRDPKQ